MFDSHCHLDLPAFDADRPAVLARAAAAGVRGVLVPGVHPATWAGLSSLRGPQAGVEVAVAVGVHPQVVPDLTAQERALALAPDRLAQAARAAGAVAIGECGLDGGTADRDEQERILRAHLRAARLIGLPVVLHVFRAHDVAPGLLREERVHEVGGIMHSYSGGAALVPIYLELGLHLAFAGPVTYAGARRPVEAARLVPDDRLLIETDAPDQSPEPHRGTRNEPAHVAEVARGLAAARATTPSAIAALTERNARVLLRL